MNDVFAVIVTYSDRFDFLHEVCDSAFKAGVSKIIIVDNGSAIGSKTKLKEYERSDQRLSVIYLDKNYGSALGYKIGMEKAFVSAECQFIWLLDDDNKPQNNSLNILLNYWEKLENSFDVGEVALLSYRADRSIYLDAIRKNNPNLILGRENGFLGFHIYDFPIKVFRFICKKLNIQPNNRTYPDIGKVEVAPYGGIFFNKKLLEYIDYPDPSYFVYADDYDWSFRIKNIFLVPDSIVVDIDTSWNLKNKKNSPFYSYLNEGNNFRVYYSVRNRIFFDCKRIKNKHLYRLNKFLYIFMLNFYKNNTNIERYNLILKAIYDGENGILGETFTNE